MTVLPLPLLIVVALASALASYVLTVLIQQKAALLGLVKAPNERSSHVVPTARGGGLGLAIVGIVGCLAFALQGTPLLAIIGVLGAVIALIGFIDDLREVSVAIRLAVQVAVVVALVVGIELFVGGASDAMPLTGIIVLGIAVVGGIWWVNAFNFMDGIDGIAASQAMLILLGALLLWLYTNGNAANDPIYGAMLVVVAATGGFLLRNWPPARIFMGDVGSTFLGLMIFAALLITVAQGALSLAAWAVLLSVFATDSMITILRRTFRGERPWRAHRRHAYQQLSRRWGHRNVTLLYAALTAFWAFPLAVASMTVPSGALWLVPTAYTFRSASYSSGPAPALARSFDGASLTLSTELVDHRKQHTTNGGFVLVVHIFLQA